MKIFAIVEYLGTAYHGWQRQNDEASVEEEIEKVLSKIFNKEIIIYASGRTDAGVHAKGQTFHFTIDKEVDLSRLLYSVNLLLPDDIHIKCFKEVSDDFHARYSAKGKHYQYLINTGDKNPFIFNRTLYFPFSFDLDIFKDCLSQFVGTHNFQDFTSKEEDEDGFVRTISSIDVKVDGDIVIVDLIGNGFMRYMIRDIIGTSLAIARGKESRDFIKKHLDSKSREIVPHNADSEGLYLIDVIY